MGILSRAKLNVNCESNRHEVYCSFAYSAFAFFRMELSRLGSRGLWGFYFTEWRLNGAAGKRSDVNVIERSRNLSAIA